MNFRTLNSLNIFPIPIGDLWNIEEDRLFLIYSPLSGQLLLSSKQEINNLEEISLGQRKSTDLQANILSKLKETGNRYVYTVPTTPNEIHEIDLLLNFKCNFSCSYCYSAAGRSSEEVNFADVKVVIDHIFSEEHYTQKPLKINFSGGGEPIISFPLVKATVDYVESKAENSDLKYSYGLVTNGSLLTSEIVDFLKEQRFNLVVSFEVLQEFQDLERGNYQKVAENIDLLIQKECPFGIRATITPQSVFHMTAMIEELLVRFPKVKGIVFDTVLSASIFQTPKQLEEYYDNFSKEYQKAKTYGSEVGIEVQCNAVETMSIVRSRTCQGKIVLTPNGVISSCARISSPKEDLYDQFVYGKVENNRVEFDSKQFKSIMSENNIDCQEKCRMCYARWNCGGGCRLFTLSFSSEFQAPFCHFTKQNLRKELFDTLNSKYSKVSGKSLLEHIENEINQGKL